MAIFSAMEARLRLPILALVCLSFVGCESEALKQNQELVQQQSLQIQQNAQEIASLKATQSYSTQAPPPGACDPGVMDRATQQGTEKYGAGDYSKALSYYQDALAACPKNAQAELNIARTYEALKNQEQALAHYRNAASSSDPKDQEAEMEARAALDRLGAVTPR